MASYAAALSMVQEEATNMYVANHLSHSLVEILIYKFCSLINSGYVGQSCH